jgi:hypothetical protein
MRGEQVVSVGCLVGVCEEHLEGPVVEFDHQVGFAKGLDGFDANCLPSIDLVVLMKSNAPDIVQVVRVLANEKHQQSQGLPNVLILIIDNQGFFAREMVIDYVLDIGLNHNHNWLPIDEPVQKHKGSPICQQNNVPDLADVIYPLHPHFEHTSLLLLQPLANFTV